MSEIHVSRIHFPVTTLGPGRRIGIWFQGCSIHCPGCISTDTWSFGSGLTTLSKVLNTIEPHFSEADGITISGGEPFDQLEALIGLLRHIRSSFTGDVLAYSGHSFEAIQDKPPIVDGLIDILISDPFNQAAPQTLSLRGSDNQRLHVLTALGAKRLAAFAGDMSKNKWALDVMFDEDGTAWFAGIPRNGDFTRLRKILESNGHRAFTSEQ